MCSILGILDIPSGSGSLRERAIHLSRIQRHRGPDWSGVFESARVVLAHERLSIVDLQTGSQPILGPGGKTVLAVNGEIYNHRALREELARPYPFRTGSDCEVIIPLLEERGTGGLTALNGIFAFILYHEQSHRYLVARDPMGVVPLYMGWDASGTLMVASEMKALVPVCRQVKEFPPGHVLDSAESPEPLPYYRPGWRGYEEVRGRRPEIGLLADSLEKAVRRQLMSDVPYGVLLSGGLDSSIVAALARKAAPHRVEDDGRSEAWWPRLHSFAIGLAGAPDLDAARIAADHLDTVHHEFHFTIREGLDALSDVIYHLETYDVTTVRASTPMYLMARRIRAMGVKVVLSGEGADEVFGGYLYFHRAPDPEAFHLETVRKVERLHAFDCLRANKSMAAWGVEARVPFLDLEFLEVAMGMDPAAKMVGSDGMEKGILREAFGHLLPVEIRTRQKEQFSDGVGYGWIDALKAHAESQVSESDLSSAAVRFPINPPATKEGYLYRAIFEEHFPLPSAAACVPGGESVACSTPEALAWDPEFGSTPDPSGRSVKGIHRDAY